MWWGDALWVQQCVIEEKTHDAPLCTLCTHLCVLTLSSQVKHTSLLNCHYTEDMNLCHAKLQTRCAVLTTGAPLCVLVSCLSFKVLPCMSDVVVTLVIIICTDDVSQTTDCMFLWVFWWPVRAVVSFVLCCSQLTVSPWSFWDTAVT